MLMNYSSIKFSVSRKLKIRCIFSNILNLCILGSKNLQKIDPAVILTFKHNIQYMLEHTTQGQNYRANKCIPIIDNAFITYAFHLRKIWQENIYINKGAQNAWIYKYEASFGNICSVFDKCFLVQIHRTTNL